MTDIVVYSKDYCPYCKRAKALLAQKGVTFKNIDVAIDPKQLGIMIKRSGGRRTVPQIFIGNLHIGGADDLFALDRSGGLDPLLKVTV